MMLMTLWNDHKASLIAIGVAAVALASSVIMVPETEQAVIVRFGDPERVINAFRPNTDFGQTGAGLVLRIPFAERVVRIDKRLLSVDMERQQVLSTYQLRLEVDAYARFRIIDPVKMVRTAGPQRQRHLEQVMANDGHLAELARKARETMPEPSRG